VYEDDAETSRGVRVGASFERARERYPELACGVNKSSEYAEYPSCTGRVGKIYISLGGDPIGSLTVSRTPLGG